jgi:hypothetical protein
VVLAFVSIVLIVPVIVPVMEVVAANREGSADSASDQRAKGSTDQTPCHTTSRGLIPGGSRPERRACAKADQGAYWRERGWTRCKCRRIGSPARWHGPARRSWERGSLSDDFIFA